MTAILYMYLLLQQQNLYKYDLNNCNTVIYLQWVVILATANKLRYAQVEKKVFEICLLLN